MIDDGDVPAQHMRKVSEGNCVCSASADDQTRGGADCLAEAGPRIPTAPCQLRG